MVGDNVTDIDCDIIYPIKSTIELALFKSELTSGKIKFRDLGSEYDNFKTSIKIETDEDNGALFEERLKYPDSPLFASFDGVYPFTPYFNYSSVSDDLKFKLESATIKPMVDLYGYVNHYDIDIIPAYDNIRDFIPLTPSDINGVCYQSSTSWSLGGVDLPYPESSFNQDNNEIQSGLQLHNNYSCVDRNVVNYLEETTISVKVNYNSAVKLLNMLLTQRDNTISLVSPAIFVPFGQQYNTNTEFSVSLSNSSIKITHRNSDDFLIAFKLQLTGVIS